MRWFWVLGFAAVGIMVAWAADNNFGTPGGSTAPGAVQMCLNSSNQAVACSTTNPLPVSGGTPSTGANNADGVAAVATGLVPVVNSNMCWNGATWDRCTGLTTGTAGSPSTSVVSTQGVSGGTATPVVQIGTANLATAQVSVSTSATLIVAARTGVQGTGRKSVTITNVGAADIYLGGSTVTTTSGTLLLGTKGTSVTIDTQAAIYGITTPSNLTVSAFETY